MIAEAVSMEDFLESLENDVAIVTPPEAAARLFVVSDIHSDYEAQCRLCKVLAWWCRSSPPWPLGTSAVGSSAALRTLEVRSVPLRAPAKAADSEAFQHQARADGDGPPNPNANRLPLRAAALVLAASTEADIEPVD